MDNRKIIIKIIIIVFMLISLITPFYKNLAPKEVTLRRFEKEEFIGPGEIKHEFKFGTFSVFYLEYKEYKYTVNVDRNFFPWMRSYSYLRKEDPTNEYLKTHVVSFRNKSYVYGETQAELVTISYSDEFYNKSVETVEVENGYFQLQINDEVRVTSVVNSSDQVLRENVFPNNVIYDSTIVTEDGRFLIDYRRIDERVSVELRLNNPMDNYRIITIEVEGSRYFDDPSQFDDHWTELGYGSLSTGFGSGSDSFTNPYKITVHTKEGSFQYDFSDVEIILKEK